MGFGDKLKIVTQGASKRNYKLIKAKQSTGMYKLTDREKEIIKLHEKDKKK